MQVHLALSVRPQGQRPLLRLQVPVRRVRAQVRAPPYRSLSFCNILRRWLTHVQGVTFGDVGMAYEIYDIPHCTRVRDGVPVHWTAHPNGCAVRPLAGSVMLWNEGGEFKWTGHVAIVTEVSDTYVRIAEQNVEDVSWEGKDYARELAVSVNSDGCYNVRETWGKKGGSVKGWMNLPHGFTPEPIPYTIPFALP